MALNLMQALNQSGLKCKILSLVPPTDINPNILSFPPESQKYYQAKSNCPLHKLFHPGNHWLLLKNMLTDAVRIFSPNMLINFTYDLLPATTQIGISTNICGIFHWSITGYERSIIESIKAKPLFSRIISNILFTYKRNKIHQCLAHLDSLIVLTNAGKTEALTLNQDLREEQIHVIPNFIPFDKPSTHISSLNNKNLIYVGRLSKEKGCYRLLDIWEKVYAKNSDWKLMIYGEGKEEIGLKLEIKKRGLQNIYFCGYEHDLDRIYKNADILLCTSDSEGFGLVLIEAMYYGVIPISFDCPVSPKELIADAGLLVSSYNCTEYAETINSLISNSTKMKNLQKKAVSRAALFYRSEIIKQWKHLIG